MIILCLDRLGPDPLTLTFDADHYCLKPNKIHSFLYFTFCPQHTKMPHQRTEYCLQSRFPELQ